MTHFPSLLTVLAVLMPLAIVLRIILFQRSDGAHRPRAAVLAYVLALAAGAVAIAMLFRLEIVQQLAQLVLNAILLLALIATRGNVVDLFRRNDSGHNFMTRLLRGDA